MTTNSFDLFTNTLPGGGSATVECQCGQLHLCPDNNNYDFDGEEDGSWARYCEAEYARHPEKVVLHYGYDAVEYKEIDGKQYAYSCDCWKSLERYELWIWNNRDIIRSYLKSRVDYELKLAEHEKLMNILMEEHQ